MDLKGYILYYSVGCSLLSVSGEFGKENKLCPEVLKSLVAWHHINANFYHAN